MTPSDPGHAFLELRKLAKERYGGNTDALIVLYAVEGFLRRLAAYPIELSLAEKIATMMSRADTNTRDRDFADVWVLSRQHQLPADELHRHLHTVAEHRGH